MNILKGAILIKGDSAFNFFIICFRKYPLCVLQAPTNTCQSLTQTACLNYLPAHFLNCTARSLFTLKSTAIIACKL